MEVCEVHDCKVVLSAAAAAVVVVVVAASLLWRPVRGWVAKAYLDRHVVKLTKSMAMAAGFYGSLLILILLLGDMSQSLGLAAALAAVWLLTWIYVAYVCMKRLEVLDRSASRD